MGGVTDGLVLEGCADKYALSMVGLAEILVFILVFVGESVDEVEFPFKFFHPT